MLACLALAGCQGAPDDSCKMAFATDLPVTISGGHLLAQALLNGEPTTMVVDTGADTTTLARSSAHKHHLQLEMLNGFAVGIGGRQQVYGFDTKTYQIGRLHGGSFRLMASDLGQVDEPGVDGLIGVDFLGAYDVDLDLSGGKFTLYRTYAGCREPRTPLGGELYSAPLVSSADARPRVEVEIGGKRLTALIDTGAPGTMLFRDSARRIGLDIDTLTTDHRFQIGGVGSRRRDAVLHVLAPIKLGDLTVSNLPVAIINQRSDDDVDMLLGLDFLSRVHPWFSFSSHTLILQFPPLPSPPQPG